MEQICELFSCSTVTKSLKTVRVCPILVRSIRGLGWVSENVLMSDKLHYTMMKACTRVFGVFDFPLVEDP